MQRPGRTSRSRWVSDSAAPGDGGAGYTTPRLNSHGTGFPDEREVVYAWHPWAGKMVRVHEVIRRPTGAIARCTAVEGEPAERAQDLPVWMLDPAWYQRMRPTVEPVASIEALMVLRDLLIQSAAGREVATGAKRWEPRITVGGRRRTLGLGRYRDVPLKAARQKAMPNWLLADEGVEPPPRPPRPRQQRDAQQHCARHRLSPRLAPCVRGEPALHDAT